jgi:flagellar basal-body rod protein FlgG
MVDMIESMRAFQAGQKVIQTIDASLSKAATQIGAVSGQ